jgi:uncharacterized cupredoxin-like copper-binding protein
MFAMKRVILAAVFVVAISGFAAAQSTSAKQATVKKGVTVKSTTKHTVLKQEASANAKSDSVIKNAKSDSVKLLLPVPKISDTTAMPVVKNDEEF